MHMQQRKRVLGNSVLGDDAGKGGKAAGGSSAAAARAAQEASLEAEEGEEDDASGKKMDVAMMSTLIENALGLFAK